MLYIYININIALIKKKNRNGAGTQGGNVVIKIPEKEMNYFTF